MIKLNVVSRIAEEKDYLTGLIKALHILKNKGLNDVYILFIGSVYSQRVLQNTLNLAQELGVISNISFTKTSIPFEELNDEIKQGYFINFTVGLFTGYSGLESIKNGFKTILYNIDHLLENDHVDQIAYCESLDALVTLIIKINNDPDKLNREIILCNQHIYKKLSLDDESTRKLLSMMSPGKPQLLLCPLEK